MDFMTSAILGGITYDFVKFGMAFSRDYVVQSLVDKVASRYVVSEAVLKEIVVQLQELPEQSRKSEDALIHAIDSNTTIQTLLHQVKPIHQEAFTNASINVRENGIVVGQNTGGIHQNIQPIDQSTAVTQHISGQNAKVAARDFIENHHPEKKNSLKT